MLGYDHQDQVRLLGQYLDCSLAVLCGVADVGAGWRNNLWKSLFQPIDDGLRVIQAQGRLSCVDHAIRLNAFEYIHVDDARNQMNRMRSFSECSDDFVVVAMPDQDDRIVLPRIPDDLNVNLRDEGTSGVDHAQLPQLRFLPNLRHYSMGAENRDCAIGNLFQIFYEHRSMSRPFTRPRSFMTDLVPHTDRRRKFSTRSWPCSVRPT